MAEEAPEALLALLMPFLLGQDDQVCSNRDGG